MAVKILAIAPLVALVAALGISATRRTRKRFNAMLETAFNERNWQ